MTGWQAEGAAGHVCWRCQANTTSFLWTQFGLTASWRKTYICQKQFLQRCLSDGSYVSAIFTIPGFQYEYISADLMHCSDLGINLSLLGNIMFELFQKLGGTFKKSAGTCSDLLVLMRIAAKELGLEPPISNLTVNMFKSEGKSPKFKLKAAESRVMLKVVHFMLTNFFKPTNDHELLRLQCTESLHNMYVELEQWGPESSPKVASYARRHCVLCAQLALNMVDENEWRGWHRWMLYPKHHVFLHCVEDQVCQSGNPRDSWCYADEDAIGKAAKIAESCHIRTLHRVVMERYRLGL
jgi:hypothetical protein